ncbi:lipase member H-like [Contarinia nasturtii]|uniref:lipase member H-like n=1 Tax=Contarinia nasturtii TaxID=265458 RepID=UPI0012D400B3|nr:lipase member H-like [Contarinia nasturtii]
MTLSGPGLALCSLFTLYFGGSPVIYSPAPRGNCQNCCPIREPRDIKFFLYTRSNPINADVLYLSDKKRFETSNFNKSNVLIIYLHGFSESVPGGAGQSSQEMRDAFLKVNDYNVLLVDWSPITALPWYWNSVQNVPRVGRYLARFIKFLNENGVNMQRIHVIGFSLGAEVAGFAGKMLKEWNLSLSRITGLDPAFPLHMFINKSTRLGVDSADFVDVIHTDGGILGYPWPLGHADFFPNRGVLQPGCLAQEISKNRWYTIVVGCSHQRAWEYFIESLSRANAFLATYCEPATEPKSLLPINNQTEINCDKKISAYMGFNADTRLRGKFYLSTNSEPPFGKN